MLRPVSPIRWSRGHRCGSGANRIRVIVHEMYCAAPRIDELQARWSVDEQWHSRQPSWLWTRFTGKLAVVTSGGSGEGHQHVPPLGAAGTAGAPRPPNPGAAPAPAALPPDGA